MTNTAFSKEDIQHPYGMTTPEFQQMIYDNMHRARPGISTTAGSLNFWVKGEPYCLTAEKPEQK